MSLLQGNQFQGGAQLLSPSAGTTVDGNSAPLAGSVATMRGETNQGAPFVYDGVHPVELPEDPHYHFLTDMTDQAVAWVKYQKALTLRNAVHQ